MNFILSIDQGTTGSRAFVFDQKGRIVATAYQEFKQYYPKPGWVEHDPEEIWQSVQNVVQKVLRNKKVASKKIKGISITNQRETTVVWNRKTSKPIHRAIVWQCRRTAPLCEKLKKKKLEPVFRKKTGLVLDPYFSGTKLHWILQKKKSYQEAASKGKLCFGTIESWLIWKLTGGKEHKSDVTNASRTLLFNIKTKKWDPLLLKTLKIPQKILPEVCESGAIFGCTDKNTINGLPSGIPITGVMGDQQAALYGQGCFKPGSLKNTYGTGSFLVLNLGKKAVFSKKGLLTTLACDIQGRPVYALEGAIFITGAVMQWLRDELKIIASAKDSEKIAKSISSTDGVYLVPAFTGLGAPHWKSDATGLICGITRGTQRSHIIRAAIESMAYQTKDVFDVLEKESKRKIRELRVDGGATENNFLMQFQSDILRRTVSRPNNIETTVSGVAYLCGLKVGLWDQKQLEKILSASMKKFQPKMTKQQSEVNLEGWRKAVERTLL